MIELVRWILSYQVPFPIVQLETQQLFGQVLGWGYLALWCLIIFSIVLLPSYSPGRANPAENISLGGVLSVFWVPIVLHMLGLWSIVITAIFVWWVLKSHI